jgi:hypothetical protein
MSALDDVQCTLAQRDLHKTTRTSAAVTAPESGQPNLQTLANAVFAGKLFAWSITAGLPLRGTVAALCLQSRRAKAVSTFVGNALRLLVAARMSWSWC